MKDMKVLLDVDGVLADYVSSVLKFLHDKTGVEFDRESISTWNIFDSFGVSCLEQDWIEYCASSKVCANVKVMQNAREFVDSIRNSGHKVEIVTSPMQTVQRWIPERLWWLNKYFSINKNDVHFKHKKYEIKGDVFIDDCIDHCVEYKSAHPNSLVILFEAPYNRSYDLTRNTIKRASSYEEALILINDFSQKV